jgi:transposase-like protein
MDAAIGGVHDLSTRFMLTLKIAWLSRMIFRRIKKTNSSHCARILFVSATIARTRRRYSDREKAEALAIFDACGNLSETSWNTGIPDATLSDWINNKRGLSSPDIPKLRNEKGQNLSDSFEDIALAACRVAQARLTGYQADKIAFNHLLTGVGIAVDKMQLFRGQPTSISESVDRNELTVILRAL